MRFTQALLAVASLALLESVEALKRKPSRWAVQRTEDIKNRLERVYGKGLVGMIDPESNRIDPARFGWDNRLTGGALLGSQISRTITPGLTIDATGAMAYWLGFTKGMQYNGLDRNTLASLPGSNTPLTNCFASMYGMLTSFDVAAYNFNTINDTAGSFKGFDVLFIDPTHIIADIVVNYEMCQVGNIINQFKAMASMDYAAVGDNLTRELMVIMVESPEARGQIAEMKNAAECVKNVADDYQEENNKDDKQDEDEFEDWEGDEGDESLNFAADPEATAKAAGECFALVDKFTVGEISGKLFAHFFNNELKPLI